MMSLRLSAATPTATRIATAVRRPSREGAARTAVSAVLIVGLALVGAPEAAAEETAPPNDLVANAAPVSLGSHVVVEMATATADEPMDQWVSSDCGNDEFFYDNSVWYTFTPERSGTYHIDATASSVAYFDVAILTDVPSGEPQSVMCGGRMLTFRAKAKETYYIAFAGFQPSWTLDFSVGEGSIQPTIDVRYNRSGLLQSDGTLRLRGDYRCERATDVWILANVGQDPTWVQHGRYREREYAIWGGGDVVVADPVCDGEWHQWVMTVDAGSSTGEGPAYHPGAAVVTAIWSNIAWCDALGCFANSSEHDKTGPITVVPARR